MKFKQFTKPFTWLLVMGLFLAVGLAACQGDAPVADEPPEAAATSAEAESPIVIEGAWSRSTPEIMSGSGIVYMVIHNNGDTADKLVAAKSDAAEVAELHDHTMDANGVMRMRPVPEGYIEIPANGSAELKSGGLHVMLINLTEPLKAGEMFPLTLKFEKFGEVTINVPVTDIEPEMAEAMSMEMAEPEETEVEVEEAAEEPAVEETTETEETAVSTTPGIAPTPRAPEDVQGGLFVNMTTDDIDRAAMAIGFATKVVNNTDKPVTIFMNTQGVRFADVTIPQNVHKSGKTIHEMLQKFMDDGGVVLLCPVCMVNVGGMAEIEALEGIIIGTPEYTWSAMFADDVTVLSY